MLNGRTGGRREGEFSCVPHVCWWPSPRRLPWSSPAWRRPRLDDGHHDGHGVKAWVDDIGNEARARNDKVDVSFKYSCDDGKHDDIKAKVTLKQDGGDTRYGGTFHLECDVDDKWVTVRLHEEKNDLDNGDATVSVALYHDDKQLASASDDDVRVSGAGGDRDRHHDGDRDGDHRHHDGDHHDDHRDHHDDRDHHDHK